MILSGNWKLVGAKSNESTPLSRAIFFIVIGIAFYLLDRFSLFIIDDYMYAFKYGTYEPIRTLKDILESQYTHYVQHNGRFLVHCVVQLFCGILGIECFRIFNTLFFVAFCGLTTRFVYNTWKSPISSYILVSLIIWLFIPRISFTILGNISCCINYLWVGVATISFLIFIQKIQSTPKYNWYINVGIAFVGMIIGSLQESFSIPISGALFIYYCCNFSKFKGSITWLICGYWIGTLGLVATPANFNRMEMLSPYYGIVGFISDSIYRMVTILTKYKPLLMFIVIIILLLLKCYDKLIRYFRENIELYLMLIIAFIFPIFVAYTDCRQLFFLGWLIIVLSLKLFSDYVDKKYIYVMIILFIPIYIGTYMAMRDLNNKRAMRVDNITKYNNGIVLAEYSYNDFVKYPRIIRHYIDVNTNDPAPYMQYASMYHTGCPNKFKVLAPCDNKTLLQSCTAKNLVDTNVFYLSDYSCYIIKVSRSQPLPQVQVKRKNPVMSYNGIVGLLLGNNMISVENIPEHQLNVIAEIDEYKYYCYYAENYIISNGGKILNVSII